jgi:hypothetical protein
MRSRDFHYAAADVLIGLTAAFIGSFVIACLI